MGNFITVQDRSSGYNRHVNLNNVFDLQWGDGGNKMYVNMDATGSNYFVLDTETAKSLLQGMGLTEEWQNNV